VYVEFTMRALLYTFSILFTTLSHGIDRPLTDFFPLAQDAKHSNLLPDSLDHLQENTASPSLQDWGQAPSSRKLPEFRPDESRLKVFSALALGDDADDESKRLVKAEGYQAPATPDEEYDLGIGVFTALFGVENIKYPWLYWKGQGKEAPIFNNSKEIFRAVWNDFSNKVRNAHKRRINDVWRRIKQEKYNTESPSEALMLHFKSVVKNNPGQAWLDIQSGAYRQFGSTFKEKAIREIVTEIKYHIKTDEKKKAMLDAVALDALKPRNLWKDETKFFEKHRDVAGVFVVKVILGDKFLDYPYCYWIMQAKPIPEYETTYHALADIWEDYKQQVQLLDLKKAQ